MLEYDGNSTQDLRSWSVPLLPRNERSYPFRTFRDSQPRLMQALHFNQPDMTGISVCCNPAPLIFYVHTAESGSTPPYADSGDDSTWTYIPFTKGERINAIWMRHRRVMDKELGLMLETNRTCHLLGTQGTGSFEDLSWSLLATPEGQPGCFYFDLHPLGPRELVFDTPITPRSRPMCPFPRSPRLTLVSLERLVWSSASLDLVTSFRECRRQHQGRLVTVGLELSYADGSRAAVGEVRLDRMADWITISSPSVWFGLWRSERDYPFIAEVRTIKPMENYLEWFFTPWTDNLEWWYSSQQCQLWYEGRASLPIQYPNMPGRGGTPEY